MQYSTELKQKNSILKWGGLSGMAGAILFVLTMVFVIVFIPDYPTGLNQHVSRFAGIKIYRVIENILYLTALLLEVPLILAFHQAFQKEQPAAALFGSTLCILGILSMAASATPHVAHSTLAALYSASEATAADQGNIAIMWQAVWGIFNAMLYVGFFIVSSGFVVIGIGWLKTPAFNRGIGGLITLSGIIGLISAILQIIDPASDVGAGSYFAGIVVYFTLGCQVFRLSRFSNESRG